MGQSSEAALSAGCGTDDSGTRDSAGALEPVAPLLDSGSFVEYVANELAIPGGSNLNIPVFDGLEADSLRILELLDVLSGLLPGCEEIEVVSPGLTWRDLYNLYERVGTGRVDIRLGCVDTERANTSIAAAELSSEVPPLSGAVVTLSPVLQRDLPMLHRMVIDNRSAWRWRFAGTMPSFEQFCNSFDSGALVQFGIRLANEPEGDVRGLAVAYNHDFRDGHCYFAVIVEPDLVGVGVGMDAAAVLLNYLFTSWNLRKVYAEAVEYNLKTYASGEGRFFKEEGRFREHHYYAGRWWDSITLAFYRDEFRRTIERMSYGELWAGSANVLSSTI